MPVSNAFDIGPSETSDTTEHPRFLLAIGCSPSRLLRPDAFGPSNCALAQLLLEYEEFLYVVALTQIARAGAKDIDDDALLARTGTGTVVVLRFY